MSCIQTGTHVWGTPSSSRTMWTFDGAAAMHSVVPRPSLIAANRPMTAAPTVSEYAAWGGNSAGMW